MFLENDTSSQLTGVNSSFLSYNDLLKSSENESKLHDKIGELICKFNDQLHKPTSLDESRLEINDQDINEAVNFFQVYCIFYFKNISLVLKTKILF